MISKDNHDTQTESRTNIQGEKLTSTDTKHLIPVNLQKLERISTERVRCEVDNKVATVKTRVHHAILVTRDSLVIPRLEHAIKLVNWSTGRDLVGVVLDPDERDISRIVEGL